MHLHNTSDDVQAADPLFAVVLSVFFLRVQYSTLTYVSLIIIVGGIILACTTEFKFVLTGFWTVMLSNACFPTRAICTKRVLLTAPMDGQVLLIYDIVELLIR